MSHSTTAVGISLFACMSVVMTPWSKGPLGLILLVGIQGSVQVQQPRAEVVYPNSPDTPQEFQNWKLGFISTWEEQPSYLVDVYLASQALTMNEALLGLQDVVVNESRITWLSRDHLAYGAPYEVAYVQDHGSCVVEGDVVGVLDQDPVRSKLIVCDLAQLLKNQLQSLQQEEGWPHHKSSIQELVRACWAVRRTGHPAVQKLVVRGHLESMSPKNSQPPLLKALVAAPRKVLREATELSAKNDASSTAGCDSRVVGRDELLFAAAPEGNIGGVRQDD